MFLNIKLGYFIAFLWSIKAAEISPLESAAPHPQCPKVDDVNNPKMLPYPQDCSKYYSCLKGFAYVKQCPGTFHWSPVTFRCEYPENAQCQQATMPPTTTAVSNLPKPISNLASDTLYQLYPNDCNRYYQCQALSCPVNYHWNGQKQQCDYPHLAQCPFRPIGTESPIIPTAATVPPTMTPISGGFEACDECASWCMGQGHIYLPYPGDCRKFVQCNGLAFVHKCPDQLLWNDKLKTCDRFCVTAAIE